MSVEEIEKVIQLWKNEFQSLAKNSSVKYIPIFENKGDVMDCNNSHPHVQIWFSSNIFIELAKETKQQLNSYNRYGNSLLSVHLDIELKKKEIIVLENEYFIALVPFWAIWPY
jgi:UDPglucose--hexose-1-phosphate uridylyltransferase